MASLTPPPPPVPAPAPWTTAQTRAQFLALAQLRWYIVKNSYHRKGGIGELIARLIFLPIIAVIAIGPIIGSGIAAYFLASTNNLDRLPALTWAIFLLTQLISINISPPALSFNVDILLRFPLSFPRYLAARLFFGLLSASNVVPTLALLAADIGLSIALPGLAVWATVLLSAYAIANILFTRMIFAWIDLWLSTRRARELFTAFIVFASLGFQYLNVTFNPGLQNHHHANPHLPLLLKTLHRIEPIAALLPPGLTASSILSFSHSSLLPATARLLGLIAFACLFLAIYARRMQREFRGENLSELTQPTKSAKQPAATPTAAAAHPSLFNPILTACLGKELLYLRRNTNQLYGFIAPVFMVLLFASRLSTSGRSGDLIFPSAVAYSILGISILSYNALGADGSGVQLYLLAPISLRDVFLAKNLIVFLLNLIEFVLLAVLLSLTGHPPTTLILLATFCWLLFTTFLNATAGNLRSLSAPKKIDLSRISRGQTSQLSALIALGIALACCAIGYAIAAYTRYIHHPWIMIPALLTLSATSFFFYLQTLRRITPYALNRREHLTEALSKP